MLLSHLQLVCCDTVNNAEIVHRRLRVLKNIVRQPSILTEGRSEILRQQSHKPSTFAGEVRSKAIDLALKGLDGPASDLTVVEVPMELLQWAYNLFCSASIWTKERKEKEPK